jgi:peptidoglycan LD-endopeptidase CwlK
MNDTSEARLDQVYPVLADKVRKMAQLLSDEGITIVVVQGLRTVEQQDHLYAQGRTMPGKIVTNARGGHSWHNFGLAVDCAPENPDSTIDWNASHPAWKTMEATGVGLGLTSGANWIRLADAPHFQLTGQWPVGAPSDEVRTLYAGGGLEAVWAALVL